MFFGKAREEKVIELMQKHLKAVDEALDLWKTFIYAYCDDVPENELKEMSYKVHLKEHEADLAKKEIQTQLVEGAFLPFYRENFLVIPVMVDKFPGLAVKSCKEIFLQHVIVPDELKGFIKKLCDSVIETYKQFLVMFEYLPNDLEKIMEISEKVSLCEQKVDTVEWKAKVYTFKESPQLEPTERLFFKEIITIIAGIADKIETTADYIALTMIKMKV